MYEFVLLLTGFLIGLYCGFWVKRKEEIDWDKYVKFKNKKGK